MGSENGVDFLQAEPPQCEISVTQVGKCSGNMSLDDKCGHSSGVSSGRGTSSLSVERNQSQDGDVKTTRNT